MKSINEFLIHIQDQLPFIEDDYYKKNQPLCYQGDFAGKEYEAYYNIAKNLKPKSILEVGVYKGYSACAIMAGANELVKYVGLDSEAYTVGTNEFAKKYIGLFISSFTNEFKHLSSIDYEIFTIDTIKNNPLELLKGATFDWVHIDAAHTKEGAIQDMLTFWPVTNKVLTLHDISFLPDVALASSYIKNKGLDGLLCTSMIKSSRGFDLFIKSF